ncbi:MAG: 30S ribosomal protein S20 [Alphaproteobacteria bacterium]
MATHKSAKKCIRKIKKRTLVNKMRVSRIRTFVHQAEKNLEDKSLDVQKTKLSVIKAEKELMSGVSKGIMHKNTAARKVSRLVKKLKLLEQAS